MNDFIRHWLALVVAMFVFGCGDAGEREKVLRVGFVPSEDAQRVMQNAQPIVEILRKRLNMEVQPFVATDWWYSIVVLLLVGWLGRASLS